MSVNRPETTRALSDMVEARLRGKTYWAREVLIGAADTRAPRVDYMSFRLAPSHSLAITPGLVEHGEFCCYEVKSCMADFKSGHGLNFVGDRNFLVCERELADRLHEQLQIPHNCAVLCPNKPRTALIEVYNTVGGRPKLRNHSAAELLFSMVISGVYRPSEKGGI